ncbi:MAG: YggT family protein [Chloroflexi bacterium]|nr:YggT family protein [Chloroflexota bacterium]
MIWLYNFINMLFSILTLAIIARAVLSWFSVSPYNPISVFLHQITEPILAPLRKIVPTAGFIDLTPLVAIILLQVVQQLILSLLFRAY